MIWGGVRWRAGAWSIRPSSSTVVRTSGCTGRPVTCGVCCVTPTARRCRSCGASPIRRRSRPRVRSHALGPQLILQTAWDGAADLGLRKEARRAVSGDDLVRKLEGDQGEHVVWRAGEGGDLLLSLGADDAEWTEHDLVAVSGDACGSGLVVVSARSRRRVVLPDADLGRHRRSAGSPGVGVLVLRGGVHAARRSPVREARPVVRPRAAHHVVQLGDGVGRRHVGDRALPVRSRPVRGGGDRRRRRQRAHDRAHGVRGDAAADGYWADRIDYVLDGEAWEMVPEPAGAWSTSATHRTRSNSGSCAGWASSVGRSAGWRGARPCPHTASTAASAHHSSRPCERLAARDRHGARALDAHLDPHRRRSRVARERDDRRRRADRRARPTGWDTTSARARSTWASPTPRSAGAAPPTGIRSRRSASSPPARRPSASSRGCSCSRTTTRSRSPSATANSTSSATDGWCSASASARSGKSSTCSACPSRGAANAPTTRSAPSAPPGAAGCRSTTDRTTTSAASSSSRTRRAPTCRSGSEAAPGDRCVGPSSWPMAGHPSRCRSTKWPRRWPGVAPDRSGSVATPRST